MSETDAPRTIRLLRDEVESWRPFLDALRADDREIARALIERCWRFAGAIEASRKSYLVEPFFLTLLLAQEERIRWLESELKRLSEEIAVWKSKDGS